MAKVDLYPDFKEFLESLNSAGVEYMVLGGYAVIHYAYKRTTDDLDVWIAISEQNAERVSTVMKEWGGFSSRTVRPAMFLKPNKVYIFGREPVRIDILTGPSGVRFDDCFARRKLAVLDGVKVPLIGLDDLVVNKRASGRNKDLADLDRLTQLEDPKPKRPGAKRRKQKPR